MSRAPAECNALTSRPVLGRVGACFLPFLFLLIGGDAAAAMAQEQSRSLRFELGVEPAEVTVGDPFRAAVRVSAPEGYSIRYLDFVSGDSVAAVAPLELVATTGAPTIAVYSLVAWAAGSQVQARAEVEVTGPDGTPRIHDVRLQLPRIASVLPPDSAEVEPRPARGLLSAPTANRFPWWWIAGLLVLVLIGWLMYRLLTRRASAVPPADAREWALRQLSDEHIAATLRPNEQDALVAHVSHVLRGYIEQARPRLGRDLTTTELLAALDSDIPPATPRAAPDGPGAGALNALYEMLRLADRVKFAGYAPSPDEAGSLLSAARDWIVRWPKSSADSMASRRAA